MVTRPKPPNMTVNVPRDPNTLSNYNNFRTTHTAVHFTLDFEKQSLSGNVILHLLSTTETETKEIVLDTSHLKIDDVKAYGKSLKWELGQRLEPYGSPLSIKLDRGVPKDETIAIEISLSTTKDCTALQWLTQAQTSNGKHPYMFSQCQAIHARSLYPCQDTPDVKSTFDFNLRSPLPVLASGLPQGISDVSGSSDKLYHFEQKVPVPSYLFAIASGDIAGESIGPRSTVWTSPDKLAGAKWELENDTEQFIKIAESLVYEYKWGTYNVLVLPPSFPYGGMENPQYTFATPTIISGDRQNVDVIAHELSHSWSGNLVSNASWEHFWLNEGWTTYLERRIQMAKYEAKEPGSGEAARDFSAIIGWKALQDSIAQFGEDHEFTKMIIDLKGKDPDDAFSSIPYEKGFLFLYHLEKLLSIEKWNKFIPHYFKTYQFKSLDSYDFKATVLSFFEGDPEAKSKLDSFDWDKWFYAPGFPPKPDFNTKMVDVCYALADKWIAMSENSTTAAFTPSKDDVARWNSSQSVVFLEALQNHAREKEPLSAELILLMGETYGYATSANVELSSRFFVLGMQSKSEEMYEPAAILCGQVGRMKFVRPLIKGLKRVDAKLAQETYEKNKDFWHPICRKMVEKILAGE